MAAKNADKANEIADLVATLAGRQAAKGPGRALTGPERAAILMLALGEKHGDKIWKLLDDDELRQLSIVMSTIGTVEAEDVEGLMLEFVGRLSASGALLGNFDATERLLVQYLPADRVSNIMEEIRGPAGRNMWEKLSNVQEQVLANYLKNEYPQTVAVVMSKLRPEHAAKVLAILPEEFALDVVNRMLKMEAVQKEVIERVEATLRTEFTFDDLVKLDNGSAQTLMRHIDKDKLAIALKGANETVRAFFLQNMSSRAAKMLLDDMQALGPVRLRDVDEAQGLLVNLAKDLAAKGEIMIAKNRADEELVY